MPEHTEECRRCDALEKNLGRLKHQVETMQQRRTPELIGFLPSRARKAWVYFGIWLPSECLRCFEEICDVHWSWRKK